MESHIIYHKKFWITFVLSIVGIFFYFYFLANQTPVPIMSKIDMIEALPERSDPVLPRCECDPDDIMCQPRIFDEWSKLLSGHNVTYKPFPQDGSFAFPWEKQLLEFPSLTDPKTLPDLKSSRFFMAGEKKKTVKCRVGERLVGRVDLRDGYDRDRGIGLDEVRAWMVDVTHPKRRAVAQVTDLGNGSYSIGVTCLWSASKAKLFAAVSYPREFLRVVVHQARHGVARYTVGRFISDDGGTEDTVCHPTPNIPGRSCLCNFTSFNGREFYCGKPLNQSLNCSHWKSTYPLPMPLPYHVTNEEEKLIKAMPGSFRDHTLKTEFIVETSKAKVSQDETLLSCFNTSSEVTWNFAQSPQGFWDTSGRWVTLLCKQSQRNLSECLENSHIYLIGDSNMHQIRLSLLKQVRSRLIFGPAWPYPEKRMNKELNITIEFRAHEYPLFLGYKWRPVVTSGSVESQINKIPSTGRQILILHYYLHLTIFHFSVVISRIQAAVEAIRGLLNRNPDAYVAFRGPHVSSKDWDFNHSIGGDPLGRFYLDIIYKAFSDIRNRVIFLDGWEMTIALENKVFHPANAVPDSMLNILWSFICE